MNSPYVEPGTPVVFGGTEYRTVELDYEGQGDPGCRGRALAVAFSITDANGGPPWPGCLWRPAGRRWRPTLLAPRC